MNEQMMNVAAALVLSLATGTVFASTVTLNEASNYYLDVNGGRVGQGQKVDIANMNGTTSQQWTYSNFNFQSNLNTGFCLDVNGGVPAEGRPVDIAICNGSPGQQWFLNAANGQITSGLGSNWCLDVYANNVSEGSQVDIANCNNTGAQSWTFTP